MKKIYWLFLLSLMFLSACGNSLSSEDFDDLGKGMTSEEVKEVLGNPKKTYKKQTEVSELIDETVSTYSQLLAMTDEDEFPNEYKKIYDRAIEFAQVKVLLEENKAITAFTYEYTYKDSDDKNQKDEKELYFYNDGLIAY